MHRATSLLLGLLILSYSSVGLAAYPGECQKLVYTTPTRVSANWVFSSVDANFANNTISRAGYHLENPAIQACRTTFAIAYKDTNGWTYGAYLGQADYQCSALDGKTEVPGLNYLSSLSCEAANPCASKEGQPGAPMYTGLPYDSQYYDTAGICDDGCVAKPASGVSSNTYAQDGSGYIIGPWTYTGEQCEAGVTPDLPPQPPPEDQDDAGNKACQSKCAGRAYQYDPETGQCECFGAPGTIDPPLDPTVPVPDPGSPSVPGAQTPATDPGGDAQLGAQIANQAKQIGQGDAQLGQLGAINNKLSAVIGNQGKQIGQGDKILDYQRRQLAALEDIRNDLAEDENGEAPDLPDQPELDGTIPDIKNWTEYDDAESIGQAQGQKQIDIIEGAQSDSPFNFGINTAGSEPCLSGPMFGTQINICFNRPWMLTGYAIMNGITISVGYLQAFLMIQKVVTGA